MTSLNIIYGIIVIIILVTIIFYIHKYVNENKILNHFFDNNCSKGICYNNLKSCTSIGAYVYTEHSKESKNIERKTYKCIMGTQDKTKLMNLSHIFVPSLFNGTYCDIVYSTYYDYNDLIYLRNRIDNMNLPISKCIRIRSYYFNPNKYLEVKYNGGTKIRALINDNYNLLEPDKLDEEYKDFLIDILNKIRNKKINPIFNNTYKRLSFVYKNNPSIRMTIDTNIEFFYKNLYNKMENDILEIKVPINISVGTVKQYLQEMNNLTNLNLQYSEFSKFEYYYYKVIMNNYM